MTQKEISIILENHEAWLANKGGERADLRDANLRGANLQDANLRCADLRGADLRGANLQGADLRGANLQGADFQSADLQSADLQSADLQRADLRHADLRGANLQDADIDYSAFPLWCGGTKIIIDDRIATQLLYHTFSAILNSDVSPQIKDLFTENVEKVVNNFHHVCECGSLYIVRNNSHNGSNEE